MVLDFELSTRLHDYQLSDLHRAILANDPHQLEKLLKDYTHQNNPKKHSPDRFGFYPFDYLETLKDRNSAQHLESIFFQYYSEPPRRKLGPTQEKLQELLKKITHIKENGEFSKLNDSLISLIIVPNSVPSSWKYIDLEGNNKSVTLKELILSLFTLEQQEDRDLLVFFLWKKLPPNYTESYTNIWKSYNPLLVKDTLTLQQIKLLFFGILLVTQDKTRLFEKHPFVFHTILDHARFDFFEYSQNKKEVGSFLRWYLQEHHKSDLIDLGLNFSNPFALISLITHEFTPDATAERMRVTQLIRTLAPRILDNFTISTDGLSKAHSVLFLDGRTDRKKKLTPIRRMIWGEIQNVIFTRFPELKEFHQIINRKTSTPDAKKDAENKLMTFNVKPLITYKMIRAYFYPEKFEGNEDIHAPAPTLEEEKNRRKQVRFENR